jgi:hypothetical protein
MKNAKLMDNEELHVQLLITKLNMCNFFFAHDTLLFFRGYFLYHTIIFQKR